MPHANDERFALSHRPLFQCEGDYWTITFAGLVCRLRDSTGLRQLAQLLGKPGERVPATELVAIAVRGSQASADRGRSPAGRVPETDRVRVTHTIRRALARIAEHHAVLNEHLRATIKTGASCAYLPDPRLSRRSSATQIVTM